MLHPLLIENKVNICIAFNTKVLCTSIIFILEMSKLTFNIFAQSHRLVGGSVVRLVPISIRTLLSQHCLRGC